MLLSGNIVGSFTDADVGGPAISGSAALNVSAYQVSLTGAGTGVASTADQFNYLSDVWTGSVTVVTNVAILPDATGLAGAMVRDTLDPASSFAAVVINGSGQISLDYRNGAGANTVVVAASATGSPTWLQLTETQANGVDSFIGLYSSDGVNWTAINTTPIAISFSNATNLAGLMSTSGNASAADTVAFNSFSATPAGLTSQDIGNPAIAGGALYDPTTGQWTVAGGGSDIYWNSDQFHFVSQTVTGDQSISALVTGETDTNGWAKAGVMFRNGTAADAVFADVVLTPSNGAAFQWRNAAGGLGSVGAAITGPAWLELVQSGENVGGFYSTDGNIWTQLGGWQSLPMSGGNVQAGLAVTAVNNSAINSSTFSNLTIAPTTPPPPPWTDQDIGNPGVAGAASFDANSGAWTVSGGGTDVYGTSDQFNFASQAVTGNQTITAQVTSQTNTYPWAKAGVMFRDGSGAGAAFAAVVVTPQNGINFQWRSVAGGPVDYVNIGGFAAPVYLRLVQQNGVFTGLYSTDGVNYTQVGAAVPIAVTNATYLAGLAVSAVNNSALNTATFANVGVAPLPAPPSPWTDQDIGLPGVAGGASYSGGVYSVSGGGGDIWNNSDQFNYASQSVTGNQTLIAQVASLGNTDPWAKAGVMFRDGNGAGAMFADVVVTPGNGVNFQWRSATGQGASAGGGIAASAPLWVKLVNNAGVFSGYYSTDGVNYTQIGSGVPIAFTNASYLAGLAVTAHNNGSLSIADFSNVAVVADAPTAISNIQAQAISNSSMELTWQNSDSTTSAITLGVSTDGGNTYSTFATLPGNATTFTMTGLNFGLSFLLEAIAGNAGGTTTAVSSPIVFNGVPTVSISTTSPLGNPISAITNSAFTLLLNANEPGLNTVQSWQINWGDGTQTVAGDPWSVTHIYTVGNHAYTISATATDQSGTYSSSNTLNVQTTPTLIAPANFTTVDDMPYQVDLAWTDPQAADGFLIEYSTDGVNWASGVTAGAGATSATVTGLAASTNYYFRIQAYKGSGNEQELSAYATTQGGTLPQPTAPAPTLSFVPADTANGQCPDTLYVDASGVPSGWELIGTNEWLNTPSFVTPAWGAPDPSQETNAWGGPYMPEAYVGNSPGWTYAVRAFAVNISGPGETATSAAITSTVPGTPVPSATGVQAVAGSAADSVTVSWTPDTSAGPVTGYYILGGDGQGPTLGGPISNGATTQFTFTNLTPGANYQFVVYQVVNVGNVVCGPTTYMNMSYTSLASPAATYSVPTASPTPPAAPTNLQCQPAADLSGIELTWADNSTNETGFTIQRSTSGDFINPVSFNVGANVTYYKDTSAVAGTTYTYRVYADGASPTPNSGYSNTSACTIPIVQLESFTVTDASAGNSGNTVTATAPESTPYPTLYVAENVDTGTATVNLSALTNSSYAPLSDVNWTATGNNASPTSGTFAGNAKPTVTLTVSDGNLDFVFTASLKYISGQPTSPTLTINVDIVQGQLNIVESDGATVLPHSQAVTTGGYVLLNSNDYNYALDANNNLIPALRQAGPVPGDAALEKLNLSLGATGGLFTVATTPGLQLWQNPNRTGQVTAANATTILTGGAMTLYVEGIDNSLTQADQTITLYWEQNANGPEITLDAVKYTVWSITGPQNVPGNANSCQYAADVPGQISGEWTTGGGVLVTNTGTPNQAEVAWASGPFVGHLVFSLGSTPWDGTWDVNVVQVVVTAGQILNPPGGAPVATSGPASTGEPVAGGNIQILGARAGNFIDFKNSVTVTGPNGGWGVKFMNIGYVQNFTVENEDGTYQNGNTRQSVMDGKTYVDVVTGQPSPWYDEGQPSALNVPGAFWQPQANGTMAMANGDEPNGLVPATSNDLATGSALKSANLRYQATMYFAVATRDTDSTVYALADATYAMNYSGQVVGGLIAPTAPQAYTSANGGALPTAMQIESFSTPVPVTGGITANDESAKETWTNLK